MCMDPFLVSRSVLELGDMAWYSLMPGEDHGWSGLVWRSRLCSSNAGARCCYCQINATHMLYDWRQTAW